MLRMSLALAFLSAPAFSAGAATPETDPRVQAVVFRDLDLATPAGVAALDRRIDAAVRNVCGNVNQSIFPARVRALRCREETRKLAQSQRERVLARAAPTIALAAR